MFEQEKAKVHEEHLPSVREIIDEYRTRGKELTEAEAEQVREQLRADARENVLGDDLLDAVAGGVISPASTETSVLPLSHDDDDDRISYDPWIP